MATLHPYLHFDGKTEAAFNFYKSVFGGEFSAVQRYSEMPPDIPSPESDVKKIMHISLPIGKGSVLMGSDRPSSLGPGTRGDNFFISIQTDTEAEAKKLFQSLSEGGKITMPLDKAFWGDLFGMLIDRFSVQWMVSYAYNR